MAQITTPPSAIFQQIQQNLRDRYPYRSGLTVLKELLQNADDAGAKLIRFVALPGWAEADNKLLRYPGILIVNDGRFDKIKDGRGILSFADSAKAGETASIGRFGFGQKAVFHLCDAFVVHAFGHADAFSTVVNPCLGVTPHNQASEWDFIERGDLDRLNASVSDLNRGLILWLPLRRAELLPAPELCFTKMTASSGQAVLSDLRQKEPELLLILSALRYLDLIEAWDDRTLLLKLSRGRDSTRMRGPSEEDRPGHGGTAHFDGRIESTTGRQHPYVGREDETMTANLAALKWQEDWPHVPVFTDLGEEMRPEKAAPHGAAVLSLGPEETPAVLTLDWGVFLPVVGESRIELPQGTPSLRMLLHGYFFVDSGRQSIQGFTEPDDTGKEATRIYSAWNKALRDELILPLVTGLIHDALSKKMLTGDQITVLVAALRKSEFWFKHSPAVAKHEALARKVERGRGGSVAARWSLIPTNEQLRPISQPDRSGNLTITGLLPDLVSWAERREVTLVAGAEAVLAAQELIWEPDEITEVLGMLPDNVFLQGGRIGALADFLDAAVRMDLRLRDAAAGPLLAALRNSLAHSLLNLASEDSLRRVLAYLPKGAAIGLPSAASNRSILRALAAATNAPLAVRSEWLEEGVGVGALVPTDAVLLFQTLAPLLQNQTTAEAANAAAVALLKLMRRDLTTAAEAPAFARLDIMRLGDGAGASRLASLPDLVAAAADGRLFRESPRARDLLPPLITAIPDCRLFLVSGPAAELLAEIGAPFGFADTTPESLCRLVAGARRFADTSERRELIGKIFTRSPDSRGALRALAAGHPDAGLPSSRLFKLERTTSSLDALALRLIGESDRDFLVPGLIADSLSGEQLRHLGIGGMDGAGLGQLIVANAGQLDRMDLSGDEIDALLLSDVPDADLRAVPIHLSEGGRRLQADMLWRVDGTWPIPASMRAYVPRAQLSRNQNVRRRQEQLISVWSCDSQIRFILATEAPHEFWREVMDVIENLETYRIDLLAHARWLPDREGTPWRPQDVLDLPEEILSEARAALGGGEGLPFLPVSDLDPAVRNNPQFESLRLFNVLPDQAESLRALLLSIKEAKPIARLGSAENYPVDALSDIARSGCALNLPGWRLLAALLRQVTSGHDAVSGREMVAAFAAVAHGDVESAAAHLNGLAPASAQLSSGEVYSAVFREICRWPVADFQSIMQRAAVPTRADTWRLGREVAGAVDGISDGYRLSEELCPFLPRDLADGDQQESHVAATGKKDATLGLRDLVRLESACADSLKHVLKQAQNDVPVELIVLTIGVLRQTPAYRALATESFGAPETVVDRVFARIRNEVDAAFVARLPGQSLSNIRQKTLLTFDLGTPDKVLVDTLSGDRAKLPTDALSPLLVLGDGHRRRQRVPPPDGEVWLHRVAIADVSSPVDNLQVKQLCLKLAEDCLGHSKESIEALRHLADACSKSDQLTIEYTCAQLEDRLPHVIAELKPVPGTSVRRALDHYNQMEGGLLPAERNAELPELKAQFWCALRTPQAEAELLEALRGKIRDLGYGPKRVLFELFQNADDASVQHAPPMQPAFVLRIEDEGLHVHHWGRLVNDLGGEGARRGWDRDLLNMLLVNLSGKPREGVTGQFGLGFKSVHLLSSDVGLASGFIACRIHGGLLPTEWPEGRQVSNSLARSGRRATVIDIPVAEDREEDAKAAVDEFRRAARWFPAMSRKIRRIVVEGDRQESWTASFFETGAEGIKLVVLDGAKPGMALALDLGDETSMFLPMDVDGPIAAEEDVPRLWLVAPLDEIVSSGWIINGHKFQVDPGRGRLSGANEGLKDLFKRLGRELGLRLVKLHDLLEDDWPGFARMLNLRDARPETGPAIFWRRTYEFFAPDHADPLASRLHGESCGYGRLIAERPVLPTGLPQPFRPFIRGDEARFEPTGALADTALIRDLNDWTSAVKFAGNTVSRVVATRLGELGFLAIRPIQLVDLLKGEIGREKRIEPGQAARLGRVIRRARLNDLLNVEREALLQVCADLNFKMTDDSWRKAQLLPREVAVGEDALIVAFAPEEAIPHAAYDGDALELYRIARDRSGFQQRADTFARWAVSINDLNRQRAILVYLLEGGQGEELGRLFAQNRPGWLPASSQQLRGSPLSSGFDEDNLSRLFGRLYPYEQRKLWFDGAVASDPGAEVPFRPTDPGEFFQQLYKWWTEKGPEEGKKVDDAAYPPDFHPRNLIGTSGVDSREDWFTFFALAIFRSIGRTTDRQHSSFVAAARRTGWWAEIANANLPDDAGPWIARLEDFASADNWRIDFPQWRRGLVDLYLLARWLPHYVEALLALPAQVRKHDKISLADAFRPSASPLWQPMGLEGAPLTQSLGIGANWLVRECVRHGIYAAAAATLMHPYGWSSTQRVRRLLREAFGQDYGERAQADLSTEIFALVRGYLPEHADFDGDLDLPLQIATRKDRGGEDFDPSEEP